jgi:hypothetical protein
MVVFCARLCRAAVAGVDGSYWLLASSSSLRKNSQLGRDKLILLRRWTLRRISTHPHVQAPEGTSSSSSLKNKKVLSVACANCINPMLAQAMAHPPR